jgi:PAX-interacting protein 1
LNAIPKLKWKTKEPLDMFIVSFHRDTDIQKIYNIKTICRAAVTVESLRSNKLIPQCKTCQSFGHTKNYCNKPPRCVKCAGPHLTSNCNKPNTEQPKCYHCGKNHSANYRGCEVIKELQKIRDNKNKSKQQGRPNKIVRVAPNTEPQNSLTPRKTYSQILSDIPNEVEQPTSTESMLVQIMQMLKEQDLRLKKIESKLKITINQ